MAATSGGSWASDFEATLPGCAFICEVPVRHRHPIADLFDLLGRRWALRVLWELRDAPADLRGAARGV